MNWGLVAVILAAGALAAYAGRARALAFARGGSAKLNSLPGHYGLFVAISTAVPALLLIALWLIAAPQLIERMVVAAFPQALDGLSVAQAEAFMRDVKALALGGVVAADTPARQQAAAEYARLWEWSEAAKAVLALILAGAGGLLAYRAIDPNLRARNAVERFVRLVLLLSSGVAILTTIGIVLSLIFESIRFFQLVPLTEFLFGLQWSPQTALRADQVGASGQFGAIPLFAGTLLITFIAMLVAAPVGLFSAVYLSEYASPTFRAIAKPVLEVLAGVPTVVYGFFAALSVAPLIRGAGEAIGLDVASESALAAGLVMGIMIIPFVSSLSDDVINAVPQSLRDGSAALGATRSETVRQVILPAALPGIVSALLLAVSRAIGETMIVVMAAGLAANLTINPLEAVTTVTVQIVTLLVGDQEFDSAKTLAAFALGLLLFCITLVLNILALHVVQKYREQYD